MLKKLLYNRRSIIFSWLTSYVLILAIPAFIACVIYVNTAQTIENEINNSNTFLLQRIQKQMDGLLSNIERLSYEISSSTRVNKVTSVRGSFESIDPYDVYLLANELSSFKAPNNSIGSLYIYFRSSDAVISNISGLASKEYFNNYISQLGTTYEKWFELISGRYKGDFVFFEGVNSKGVTVKTVAFIQSIPIGNQRNNDANIIITIDENMFTQDFNDMQNQFQIIDSNNNVITPFKSEGIIKNLIYHKMVGKYGIIHEKDQKENVVVSFITSNITSWKYIVSVPESVFWQKLEYVRNLTFFSLFICILLGGFIIYFSLKKNYNPVSKLVQSIEKYQGLSFDKKNNEYSFILDTINKAKDEKAKVDEIIFQQNKVLKYSFLSRLLKGREIGKKYMQETMKLHNIQFVSDYFAVIVFFINDYGKANIDEKADFDEVSNIQDYKLAQFIITNVVEELAKQKNQGFMTDVDDVMACLINFNPNEVINAKEELIRIIEETEAFLTKHFSISFMASVSSINELAESIPEAYNQAIEAMEYKKILGIDDIVLYDDVKSNKQNDYYYPLEKEQQLINCIKTGNYEKAKGIMNEIFQKDFAKSLLAVEISKCLMFNMLNTMLKTVSGVTSIGHDELVGELNRVERLLKCTSIPEIREEMFYILKVFCNYVDNESRVRNKNEENQWKRKIQEYVKANYADINMSFTSIADFFSIHPVYLSKVFRDQSGENLLDYINTIRIEKAKLLIKEQSYTLEDLSREVGYANTKTFTRAFKKHEGMTPGKYKDSR